MTTYVAVLKQNGLELARSNETQLVEGNQYFPPSSVQKAFADSPTAYTCPWKGPAQYHNLIKGAEVKDAAWSYDNPSDAAKHIKGYYAFDKSQVEIKAV